MHYISLGSSCDTKGNLERLGINGPTMFFDYLWNELSGLKEVTRIIKDDFQNFDSPSKFERTRNHPTLTWDTFWVSTYYPTISFFHFDPSQQDTIDSFARKIERIKEVLSSKEKKVFLYYRHYNCEFKTCTNLNVLIEESEEFCKIFKDKYDNNFLLVSLAVFDPSISKENIDAEMAPLKEHNTENLVFDFVYRRTNKDLAEASWDTVFQTYCK